MSTVAQVAVAFFAAVGFCFLVGVLVQAFSRRRMRFTCLYLTDRDEEPPPAGDASAPLEEARVILLCRSTLEEDEIIRRIDQKTEHKIYIRRW